jgi:hypothetical protein
LLFGMLLLLEEAGPGRVSGQAAAYSCILLSVGGSGRPGTMR